MARLLLGVTGGIAAYKALELVRLATGAGHAVRVLQTPRSREFVGPASFAALTGAPILTDEFAEVVINDRLEDAAARLERIVRSALDYP